MSWTRKTRTWRTRDEKLRSQIARNAPPAPLSALQPSVPLERTILKIAALLQANQRPRCENQCPKRMVIVYNRVIEGPIWSCTFCGAIREVDRDRFSAFVESLSA